MKTILTLIDRYNRNPADNKDYEGKFFVDARSRLFQLNASLILVPAEFSICEKIKRVFHSHYQRPEKHFGTQAIKSALLKRAKEEGVVFDLQSSKLWRDLTALIYTGL